MKRLEMTREVKEELWRLFDRGITVGSITINGHKLPQEAVEKQHTLWKEFRTRNPKR